MRNLPIHAILFDRQARTVTENGVVKSLEHTSDLVLILDISAVSGTPTLDVTIEEYDPATDTYFLIDTFPQQTGVTKVRRTIAAGVSGKFLRAVATIGGSTPSLTFAVGALSA